MLMWRHAIAGLLLATLGACNGDGSTPEPPQSRTELPSAAEICSAVRQLVGDEEWAFWRVEEEGFSGLRALPGYWFTRAVPHEVLVGDWLVGVGLASETPQAATVIEEVDVSWNYNTNRRVVHLWAMPRANRPGKQEAIK